MHLSIPAVYLYFRGLKVEQHLREPWYFYHYCSLNTGLTQQIIIKHISDSGKVVGKNTARQKDKNVLVQA